ncbi:elongator complex protein 3 [Pyrobaculum aerophilum]|nr:elongator complex protein 3 [Pyrobaculum aerophilum]HII48111.1 tRNA uridine(34) 5-carboxymethylaminomethyl modification radical SAM/GNAT enzyme Elp3 [Pyrobaculum aerophilum]
MEKPLRFIRMASGVHVVALMTQPFPCPGRCTFCPSSADAPKSYMPDSPVVLRAKRNRYDPYLQTAGRIKVYIENGHTPSKIEAVIMGGTFSALPRGYREWFVANIYKALNDFPHWTSSADPTPNLEAEQIRNETAELRMVALTVETRPDFINKAEVDFLLKLGVTRVELGVQSIYDDVLQKVKRGHGAAEVVEATAILKDSAYKVCYHVMPGLPGSDPDRDLEMVREIFSNPSYMPDCVKIYPLYVVPNTELSEDWRRGLYKSYDEETWLELLAKIYASIPRWVRVMRFGRDIPLHHVLDGPRWGNMRQIVLKHMERLGLKCQEIRCREVGIKLANNVPIQPGPVEVKKTEYEASGGLEIFLEAVGPDDTLYAILRLRIPNRPHRPELYKAALVRELHVYGPAVPVGKQGIWWQHSGMGRELMRLAEEIAGEFGALKIAVISGVGVREYYRKLGYERCGPYMCKPLGAPLGVADDGLVAG